ncbi:MAG TPA: VWA domain-containing protein [Pyrinomonadaceae bacterium]|nr:VWA domain-containing protein [Pyrinomonadaceae bacterium]
MTRIITLLVIALLLSVAVFAQQTKPSKQPKPSPAATPPPRPADEDDVVRIDLNLVQVDAVVTDKRGRQVSDLSAQDFSIIENGKSHTVDYCVYVPLADRESTIKPTPTTQPPSAAELGRTFVFIVDNPRIEVAWSNANAYGISSGGLTLLRRAIRGAEEAEKLLTSFVDKELGPRDLMAIGDTEVDIGVLSSFTNDRAALKQAIRQIRSNPTSGRAPVIRITSINGNYSLKDLANQNLRVLDTISSVIKQLEPVPGRKVITLLSRGMLFEPQLQGADIVIERMRKLIEQANRARVSINALSPAGLPINSGTDTLQNFDGMIYLANETGGRAIYNTNDTRVGFAEIVERSRGYYLLAYKSDPETHARPHALKVRLNRDDLRVEARTTGYTRAAAPASAESLSAAINSPLRETAIPIEVTPTFVPAVNRKGGDIQLVIKVGLRDTELVNTTELAKADFELAVRITGPDGKLLPPSIHQLTLRAKAEDRNHALQEGITARFQIPVDAPGFYRISVAVQSKRTKELGSTHSLIEAIKPQKGTKSTK